ncbi:MAG: 5-formyltetrahydrofolate cyclo-ligase [Chlamydiia bacterium]
MDKRSIRLEIQKQLKKRTHFQIDSNRLLARILPFLGKNVLSYFPISLEPDISPLNRSLFKAGRLFFPKIEETGLVVEKVIELDPLHLDLHDTHLPHAFEPANLDEIDTVILPLVAADLQLNRLGRGKGHYDRLLTNRAISKIAILFECQLVAAIPIDPWDQPLDKIFIF